MLHIYEVQESGPFSAVHTWDILIKQHPIHEGAAPHLEFEVQESRE
jgi:hypothetical protein